MNIPAIHRYHSKPEGFYVNSWIVEFDDALVIVDSQFLVSEALGLIRAVEKTGKRPVALLITHPHPDHYNGTHLIKAEFPQIEVISTKKTFEGIKASAGPKREYWTPIYGDDYPASTMLPERIAESGVPITLAGSEFVFQDAGPGECENLSTIKLPAHGILFSSDLIYNEVHPWLAEGRSMDWLQQILTALRAHSRVKSVFPGHGPETTLEGFHKVLNYINRFHQLIRTHANAGAVAAGIKNEFKGYQLEMLVELSIPAVAKELGLEITNDHKIKL